MNTALHLFTRPSLTLLVFFPTVACLPLLVFPSVRQEAIRLYLLAVSLVEVSIGVVIVAPRLSAGRFETVREVAADGAVIDWIPSLGIAYRLRLDGISLPLVALTLLVLPLVVLGSWREIERHWKVYAAALLLVTTGILGALLAFDLFLFYVFWEIVLVPTFLLIGIWGGRRKIYAAVKFFLFATGGSLPMLLAILWLGWSYRGVTGAWSFAHADLLTLELPLGPQLWLFAAFALAFAVRVPMVPLHSWLPGAHVAAPTGASVVLAGAMLQLGTYGFLRFALPLFPHAAHEATPLLVALAVVGIVYGALVAWAQTDIKRLVAYSSIAQLGFVVLGLAAVDLVAWQGALLQMVNHGLCIAALFLLVGMLDGRVRSRRFDDLGGLARVMPRFAFFLVFSALAALGLPMLNGFVGEFLILVGTYGSTALDLRWAAIVATLGIVLAAVYLFEMLHHTVWGPITRPVNERLADLDAREIVTLAPLCLLMLAIGVAPRLFLAPSRADLESTLSRYEERLARDPSPRVALATPDRSGPRPPVDRGSVTERIAEERTP